MMSNNLLRCWLDPLISCSEGIRSALDGKRVLVTGVSGFVGTWLAAALLRFAETGTSLRVIGIARNPELIRERLSPYLCLAPLELTAADLSDPMSAIPDANIVIHASGAVSAGLSPDILLGSLVGASDKIVSHAASAGAERFLFVSSGAVYGPQPASIKCLKESWSGAPDSCGVDYYGNMKRWSETLCLIRGQSSGMHVTIARCFSFSGAFLPLNGRFALGNFVRDALEGGPVVVKGLGTPVRTYLDGGEMALWLLAVLLRGQNGACYNIGSPDTVSIAEAAETVARLFGCSSVVEGGADGTLRYVPCTEKAKRELGLVQTVNFEESVRRMGLWYKGSAK